jgi:Resolvase, N terminal domain
MLTIMGGIAEFERGLIRSRCEEGIAKAKRRGTQFGRPSALDASRRICSEPNAALGVINCLAKSNRLNSLAKSESVALRLPNQTQSKAGRRRQARLVKGPLSAVKVRPASACSRAMSGSLIAEAVLQNPPPTASCEMSRARQMPLSAIILDVEP